MKDADILKLTSLHIGDTVIDILDFIEDYKNDKQNIDQESAALRLERRLTLLYFSIQGIPNKENNID